MIRTSFKLLLEKFPDRDLVGVEVGSASGENAIAMLNGSKNLTQLYLVDNNPHGFIHKALKPFESRAVLVVKPSVEASKDFPDKFFDYIYIDADHEFESVCQDIEVWMPKLKEHGIISGHDWWYKPVRDAVNYSIAKKIIPSLTGCEEINYLCDWWIIK